MIKVAIVGAGMMARVRARALLTTNQVQLCGVASSHIESANKFAHEFDIPYATTSYKSLLKQQPDALLVETPHKIQDEVVRWALKEGLNVMIGGCLSTNVEIGEEILSISDQKGLIVECGYEARYKPCWRHVKQQLDHKVIGMPSIINSIALWDAPPNSWYYNQDESGGMPVTHITYAFINPLRWIFGEPTQVSAMSNKLKETKSYHVDEESCIINIQFPNQVLVSLTAGYVTAPDKTHWHLDIFGTDGMLEIHPGDMDAGLVRHYSRESGVMTSDFSDSENAFNRQAQVFIDQISNNDLNDGSEMLLNTPKSAINDIRIAEAITRSTKKKDVVCL